jgi:hypothetical protein
MTLRDRFWAARPFESFLESAQQNAALWRSIYDRARVPEDLLQRARELSGRWHLLVLLEDWCGDAVNSVPFLARLAHEVPNLELRVLERDQNLDLMARYLSPSGGLAIPVVIALNENLEEVGWWGSRPTVLQRWVDSTEAQLLSKEDRYREIRRWYARDRGATSVSEVLGLLGSGITSARSRNAGGAAA